MQGSELSLQVALKWILQRGVAVATQSTSFFGCSNRPVDYIYVVYKYTWKKTADFEEEIGSAFWSVFQISGR